MNITIKITVKGLDLELTLDEARNLAEELAFLAQPAQPCPYVPYPSAPYTPPFTIPSTPAPFPTYPITTCKS